MLRVIKASAGSGKTYTLVKEYLRLALRQPESYFKHILAITFTNKAANEMKERVIQKLYDLSVSADGEKHLRNHLCNELNIKEEELAYRCNVMLNAILHHYGDVSISTIDSFTHQVLRSFAYELKINMHAEIETDYDMVLEQVVNLLMDNIADEKHTENDQEKKYLSRALIEFAFNKMEEGGSWNIDRNLLLFAHNLIRDDTYIYFNSLQDTSVPHLLETQRYLYKIIKQFNEQTKKTAKKALELIEAHQINEDEFYNKNRGIISYFKNVIHEGLKYKYAEEGSSNHRTTIYENKWYKGKTNPAIDNIKDQLSQYFFQLTTAFKTQGRRARLAKIISKNIFPFMLLKAMDRQLRAYLKENHLLLLHEAQQKVYAEVKDQPAPVIFEKIGSRFNHVMIDEFQDTSVLQWHNLLPLIDHAVTEGNECLLVGDAKQAIYRFRGGEVKQFTMLPEIYASDKDKVLKEREINIKNHGVVLQTLEYNFRSRENIIDFNNKFYEWAQQSNRLANKTAYDGLRQKNGTGKTGGNVTICFTEKKKKGEVNPAHIHTERFIREALNQGYSQRDIAVLCEKNSTAAEIARYLLSCGFQVISPESLLISQAASVKLLESALLYLQNRENLIARAELWNELRGWFKLPPTENFSEVLGSYSYFEEKISSLLGRDFNSDQLVGRKLFDLILVLMDLFRIDPLTDPFVHFFLDEVLNYSQKYQPGISQFTDWWKQQQISVTFPESLDAIRLMTVHKSKGLEFPVVILPGANYDVKPKKK
ncbi:MAG: UvrD-helicase domain-containing protein, partial [Chitinophagales bacterium]|nr:UvrD-helicase domain-containing protein [Chitinophagales bacterium]